KFSGVTGKCCDLPSCMEGQAAAWVTSGCVNWDDSDRTLIGSLKPDCKRQPVTRYAIRSAVQIFQCTSASSRSVPGKTVAGAFDSHGGPAWELEMSHALATVWLEKR